MSVLQLGQKERLGLTIETDSSEYRKIITFKKLPIVAPMIKLRIKPDKNKNDHLKLKFWRNAGSFFVPRVIRTVEFYRENFFSRYHQLIFKELGISDRVIGD